jgi:hypothetical protein
MAECIGDESNGNIAAVCHDKGPPHIASQVTRLQVGCVLFVTQTAHLFSTLFLLRAYALSHCCKLPVITFVLNILSLFLFILLEYGGFMEQCGECQQL